VTHNQLITNTPEFHRLQIEDIKEETNGFKTIVFGNNHSIKYQPGQFLPLVDHQGGKEIRRSYSITSSPVLNEPLSIAVKRIENGYFSRKLVDNAKNGDILLTTGAAGFFRLPEQIENFDSIFFFAAGSGIAPILSLLKTVLSLYPEIQVYLIYSNRSPGTMAFGEELNQLRIKFPEKLYIDFLYSSESDLRRARLNTDLLLDILSAARFDRNRTLFYTCGPEVYMRMIIFLLVEEGFPKDHIKKEDFNPGNKKPTRRMPPDKNNYTVNINLKGNQVEFRVHYPDTILQAAKKIGLNLPYSCETGKCGSCAAICISGKVWMSNNEVLTDIDLAKGLILTCTGHPQHGNAVLKIE
jgi:ferredoxin-NADP reductase